MQTRFLLPLTLTLTLTRHLIGETLITPSIAALGYGRRYSECPANAPTRRALLRNSCSQLPSPLLPLCFEYKERQTFTCDIADTGLFLPEVLILELNSLFSIIDIQDPYPHSLATWMILTAHAQRASLQRRTSPPLKKVAAMRRSSYNSIQKPTNFEMLSLSPSDGGDADLRRREGRRLLM